MKIRSRPLKLANRHYYPFLLLGGFVLAVAFAMSFPEGRHIEILISIVGAFAGTTYFLYSQHTENTRLFTDLFREFNQRYDKMNAQLNGLLNVDSRQALSEEERGWLFDYFNLCAEEYLYYNAGYIDENVWRSWSNGMLQFFQNTRIAQLWEEERISDSYYGFNPTS